MIDGSVLQSAQRCFEKKSRVVVKMVVIQNGSRTKSNKNVCHVILLLDFAIPTEANNRQLFSRGMMGVITPQAAQTRCMWSSLKNRKG